MFTRAKSAKKPESTKDEHEQAPSSSNPTSNESGSESQTSPTLTQDQLDRIEKNRKRALDIRNEKEKIAKV